MEPGALQSDGQAEHAVQTVKQRMARCKQDGQDFKQADENNTHEQRSTKSL